MTSLINKSGTTCSHIGVIVVTQLTLGGTLFRGTANNSMEMAPKTPTAKIKLSRHQITDQTKC